MSEALAAPTPEELLRASLMEQHGNALITKHGQTFTLQEFDALANVLCPVPADQRSAAEDIVFLTDTLQESGVEVGETYLAFVNDIKARETQPAKQAESLTSTETLKSNQAIKPDEPAKRRTPQHLEVASMSVEIDYPEREPVKAIVPESTIVQQLKQVLMEQTVARLNPVSEAIVPTQPAAKTQEKPVQSRTRAETPTIILKQPPLPAATEAFTVIEPLISELLTTEIGISDREEMLEYSEEVETISVSVEPSPVMTLEAVESDFAADLALVTSADVLQVESSESIELSVPESAVVINEFMAVFQIAAPEAVTAVLAELTPEAVAEVASQIEMLVVVADRLHALEMAGTSDGEEGRQIIAFLAREYEQLLVSLGVEATPEVIEKFILYVRSENYNLHTLSFVTDSQEYEEGTHEKKLFDEQSVFAKAQLASARLGQGIGTMIGRLAVNRSAA